MDRRRIKFVQKLSATVKADIIYLYLHEGKSHRKIEEQVSILQPSDGWQAWSVLNYYGFGAESKAKYPKLTRNEIIRYLNKLDEQDFAEFHTGEEKQESYFNSIGFNQSDGKDIFGLIKIRVGQAKLRKMILQQYAGSCALCEVSDPRLLVVSHIKRWTDSSEQERIDLSNSILLYSLHDAMFDKGLISMDDTYEVLYKDEESLKQQKLRTDLKFKRPLKNNPKSSYLKEHRIRFKF